MTLHRVVIVAVVLVVVVLIGAIADQLLRAAERRGWVYYRETKPSRTAVGNAMMTVASIYAPEQAKAVAESREYDTDEADDDDPLGLSWRWLPGVDGRRER